MIEPSKSSAPGNPFNPRAGKTSTRTAADADVFSRRLSEAVSASSRTTARASRFTLAAGISRNGSPAAASSPSPAAAVLVKSVVAPAASSEISDAIPDGGGKTTATGCPDIQLSASPCRNQYGYTGPAAFNPYFTTPANPMREGYVTGFRNWFLDASITGGPQGSVPANRLYFTTAEGAKEALRLVREHQPAAELEESAWGGGPFAASSPMYMIRLPGNRSLNAGLLLAAYYNGGAGVSASSDFYLARELSMA